MENSILYSEINIVCILVLVMLSVKVKNSMLIQNQRQKFLAVIIVNIFFLLLDAIWIFVDNRVLGLTYELNWGLNCVYYMLSGVVGYSWFLFSETVQRSALLQKRSYRVLSMLPMIIIFVLTMISVRTGWLFYIDEANVYHRGPFYVIQLFFSYGYVLFTAVKAYCTSLRTQDYQTKRDNRALALYVLPSMLAGLIQILFPGYPILCVGNTMGILYVYITLQEQLVSKDALTNLSNRNQLMQYLSGKLAHPVENKALYLLMMDLDYFKTINDRYGHVEGDQALKTVADCLIKACSAKHHFIARYGGDEFIILCELSIDESVQSVCDAIRKELKKVHKPYGLSLSIGYARYTAAIHSQQQFIAKADAALYKEKEKRHKGKAL
ncbi:MAG: diguanylate cyclase [Eubacteriales bacterium]|nr:diguanylate cyclase [Eubacteriales bacterium]